MRHVGRRIQAIKFLALKFHLKVAYSIEVSISQYRRDCQLNYSGIHLSSFLGLEKIVGYQLEDGALADVRGGDGMSPLSIAVKCGRQAVVELLLSRDDVNVDSENGCRCHLSMGMMWWGCSSRGAMSTPI
jgi:ankyrin repeat protein